MIRRATIDDTDALAVLWNTTALTAYAHIFPPEAPTPTVAEMAAQIRADFADPTTVAFVALDDDDVVGMAMASAWPGDEVTGRFFRMYVAPTHWARGIGRRLHDHAVAALTEAGFAAAKLWVIRDNARARTFYERNGWKCNEITAPVFGDIVLDVQYQRPLTDRVTGR